MESLSRTLSDNELEKFLIRFKSDIENKNVDALKKEIDLSPAALSWFQKLFQTESRPGVEIRQVRQEGASVRVEFQTTPHASHEGDALLLYQDGAWHLSPPVHS